MQQVLANAMTNACKHTSEGDICVRVWIERGTTESVGDSSAQQQRPPTPSSSTSSAATSSANSSAPPSSSAASSSTSSSSSTLSVARAAAPAKETLSIRSPPPAGGPLVDLRSPLYGSSSSSPVALLAQFPAPSTAAGAAERGKAATSAAGTFGGRYGEDAPIDLGEIGEEDWYKGKKPSRPRMTRYPLVDADAAHHGGLGAASKFVRRFVGLISWTSSNTDAGETAAKPPLAMVAPGGADSQQQQQQQHQSSIGATGLDRSGSTLSSPAGTPVGGGGGGGGGADDAALPPAGGESTAAAADWAASWVVVEVSDTGGGLRGRKGRTFFEPYSQGVAPPPTTAALRSPARSRWLRRGATPASSSSASTASTSTTGGSGNPAHPGAAVSASAASATHSTGHALGRSSVQEAVKGTGLGLSLAGRLVSLMGGHVALTELRGRTRFVVRVPLFLSLSGENHRDATLDDSAPLPLAGAGVRGVLLDYSPEASGTLLARVRGEPPAAQQQQQHHLGQPLQHPSDEVALAVGGGQQQQQPLPLVFRHHSSQWAGRSRTSSPISERNTPETGRSGGDAGGSGGGGGGFGKDDKMRRSLSPLNAASSSSAAAATAAGSGGGDSGGGTGPVNWHRAVSWTSNEALSPTSLSVMQGDHPMSMEDSGRHGALSDLSSVLGEVAATGGVDPARVGVGSVPSISTEGSGGGGAPTATASRPPTLMFRQHTTEERVDPSTSAAPGPLLRRADGAAVTAAVFAVSSGSLRDHRPSRLTEWQQHPASDQPLRDVEGGAVVGEAAVPDFYRRGLSSATAGASSDGSGDWSAAGNRSASSSFTETSSAAPGGEGMSLQQERGVDVEAGGASRPQALQSAQQRHGVASGRSGAPPSPHSIASSGSSSSSSSGPTTSSPKALYRGATGPAQSAGSPGDVYYTSAAGTAAATAAAGGPRSTASRSLSSVPYPGGVAGGGGAHAALSGHLSAAQLVVSSRVASAAAPAPHPLQLHVLVVEDDATNRLLVGRMLKRIGCTFDALVDGDEVAARLTETGQLRGAWVPPYSAAPPTTLSPPDPQPPRSAPFDAILMDIVMQRSSGDIICRELVRGGLRVPVFPMTANATAKDRANYAACGFQSIVVAKPFGVEVLRGALTAAAEIRSEAIAAAATASAASAAVTARMYAPALGGGTL